MVALRVLWSESGDAQNEVETRLGLDNLGDLFDLERKGGILKRLLHFAALEGADPAQIDEECRGLLGSDEEAFKATIAALAKDGSENVLARLHAGAEGGVS